MHLADGRILEREKQDYEGFHTRPMQWSAVAAKFERLSQRYIGSRLAQQITEAVKTLETIQVTELVHLLAEVEDFAAERELP